MNSSSSSFVEFNGYASIIVPYRFTLFTLAYTKLKPSF